MPYRRSPICIGDCFHIYNRGVAKNRIFFSNGNYRFFKLRMLEYISPAADILAYCLMPNHFHLMVRPKVETFSQAMQKLCCSYAKAINKAFGRTGALFESRFKSVRVDDDVYFEHLNRYIHMNPVRASITAKPEDWEFSSMQEYLSPTRSGLITPDQVLSRFQSLDDYYAFVTAPLTEEPIDFERLTLDSWREVDRNPSSNR